MRLDDLETTAIYDAYWKFAYDRQEVFFKRYKKSARPWTDDEIIQKYKFTNVYRASDRVSQYLIKNVIYNEGTYSPEDTIFRILFFKFFNKIDTWEYVENVIGEITFKTFNYDRYDKILSSLLEKKEAIYSAAYIMPSGKSCFGYEKKHQNHLCLLEVMMKSGLSEQISKSRSLEALYYTLLEYPSIGRFLAFQYAIDLNYSELCDFSEMDYVVAGPGAINGINKCFKNAKLYSYNDIIRYVCERQRFEFEKRGLDFKSLFGRELQLIDCQNLFCEIDKYARVAFPDCVGGNRKRIKQQYINRNLDDIDYFFPPKWGINDFI